MDNISASLKRLLEPAPPPKRDLIGRHKIDDSDIDAAKDDPYHEILVAIESENPNSPILKEVLNTLVSTELEDSSSEEGFAGRIANAVLEKLGEPYNISDDPLLGRVLDKFPSLTESFGPPIYEDSGDLNDVRVKTEAKLQSIEDLTQRLTKINSIEKPGQLQCLFIDLTLAVKVLTPSGSQTISGTHWAGFYYLDFSVSIALLDLAEKCLDLRIEDVPKSVFDSVLEPNTEQLEPLNEWFDRMQNGVLRVLRDPNETILAKDRKTLVELLGRQDDLTVAEILTSKSKSTTYTMQKASRCGHYVQPPTQTERAQLAARIKEILGKQAEDSANQTLHDVLPLRDGQTPSPLTGPSRATPMNGTRTNENQDLPVYASAATRK